MQPSNCPRGPSRTRTMRELSSTTIVGVLELLRANQDTTKRSKSSLPGPSSLCQPSRWKVMQTELPIRTARRMPANFPGKYEHRVITGGIGHNLPQEAPKEFAKAIIDAGQL